LNPELDILLSSTERVMDGQAALAGRQSGPVRAGVDLGTAYTVVAVLDAQGQPLAGTYRFAQVVRDGLVVDFVGAVDLLRNLKSKVEQRLGFELRQAATGYPPGVPLAEVRATAHVLEAAGLECSRLIDEPTAANNVLQIRDGAIVDVGGGTTGVAVFKDGQVVYTADEATGGTHFSLVIAGARNISFERAETLKQDPAQQAGLLPVVRPVMEKVATIVERHIAGHAVETIYLVGGTVRFPGIAPVIEEITGIRTIIPGQPLFVTPLGIALSDRS
jgi:ethanolamine utilization protein EutJ